MTLLRRLWAHLTGPSSWYRRENAAIARELLRRQEVQRRMERLLR